MQSKITVTGHRGAAGLCPENTLISVSKALELSVDRVEIDVQQTKDDVVIVLHDATLDRTTDASGAVKDWEYAQIAKLDAGSKFDSKFAGEKIPTLAEVIELVNAQAALVIEIKGGHAVYPFIEKNVIDIIHQAKAQSWCIIQSFGDEVLAKVQAIDPEISLHKLLVGKFPFLPLGVDKKFGYMDLDEYGYAKELSVYCKFVTHKLIQEVHARGQKINVWTVNDKVLIARFIKMGVDGIITDRPDLISNK